MLNIPSTVKALFQTDGVYKNFRVHFPNGEMSDITNDNVVSESVKFTESLCSQDTFKFGLAEASVLEFETVGVANMYGMTIEASIEIDCSSLSAGDKSAIAAGTWDGTYDAVNEVFGVPYGVFRVESCPRDHHSMAHRQVTAYTLTVAGSDNYPYLPNLLFSKVKIRSRAILAQMFGEGLSTMPQPSNKGIRGTIEDSEFYTSNGHRISLQLFRTKSTQAGNGMCQFAYFDLSNGNVYDFAKFEGTYDADAYYQIGVDIANALDAQGDDLIYDPNGTAVYSSNLEALLDKAPSLFYPCIGLTYSDGSNSIYNAHGRTAAKVNPNELFPVVVEPNYGEDRAFVVYSESNNGISIHGFAESFAAIKAYAGESLQLLVVDDDSSSSHWVTIPTSADIPEFTYKLYKMDTANYSSGPYITLTGQAGGTLFTKTNNNKKKTLNVYQYSGLYPVLDYINGYLEISCKFCKQGRDGTGDLIHLDDSSPISVIPENYEEMWWDEYDIAPIGTVTITYQNSDGNGGVQENIAAIKIGTGASQYDMADNIVLKNLDSAGLYSVKSLINTNFKPYAGDVAFTPTELTMQGWPWVEAGDALQITAEDGTVVNTYALRIEMSGIQNLKSVITAQGGEIIEEVE